MAYLGNNLQVAYPSYRTIDDISSQFNGVLKTFALRIGGVAAVPFPINPQQCLISVNGVIQKPDSTGTTGFTLTGTNIVFASAPSAGWAFFGTVLAGADYVNVGANFPSGTAAVPSVTFDQSTGTGLYLASSNVLGIATSGVQQLTVDSSGNVSITGIISAAAGTAAAPAYRFTGDTNTGIYSPGADQVAISTNGTSRVAVQSDGNVLIGATGSAIRLLTVNQTGITGGEYGIRVSQSSATSNAVELTIDSANGLSKLFQKSTIPLVFGTNDTERARIDSSGRLLVGTSSARSNFFNSTDAPQVQLEGTTTSTSTLAIIRNSDNISYPSLTFGKTRGSSVGSTTVVQSGDNVGSLEFQGSDGTEFVQAASIRAEVDGTPGANDMPGRLVFSTTADGASSPTERMRIDNGGIVYAGGRTSARPFITLGTPKFQTDVAGFLATNGSNDGQYGMDRIAFNAGQFYVINGSSVGVVLTNGQTAWAAQSDERLKTNLSEIGNGLSKVGSLRAVTGRYASDDEGVSRAFLIAQDVAKVLPEAVTEADDEDKTLSLRYTEMIPLLVAALKESKERIEQLEAKVAALEAS